MISFKRIVAVIAVVGAIIGLSACNNTKSDSASASAAHKMAGVSEVYEVYHDGRINVFYDHKTYEEFLALGEVTFRLTRIGAGPNGETMVFGMTKHDKKIGEKLPIVKLYDGKIKADEKFYGEARRHGRIYVYSNYEDMEPLRSFGNPDFFYMEVGAGPKGETVVFVLNKHTKKHKPVALIEEFKARNS